MTEQPICNVEALLASHIETSADGVLVTRTSGGVARYNRPFAALWAIAGGSDAGEMDRVFDRVFARVEAPARLAAEVRDLCASPERYAESEIELRDGRVVAMRSGPVRDASGTCVARTWFFRDVSEQRHSERALRASNALLAETQRIAQVGGWEWDVARDIMIWSRETYRMFGLSPHGPPPTVVEVLLTIHPDDRERVRGEMKARLTSAQPYEGEFRVTPPGQSERVIRVQAETTLGPDGRAVRMTGTTRDVTEQKTIENELRFANALTTAQIESSPDGILVVGADGRIVSFNRRFTELWDVPADVIRSRNDEAVVAAVLRLLNAPEDFQRDLESLYALPADHAHSEIELKDGRVFERHSSPLPIAPGEDHGRIFFFRDITARKRAEVQIARMAREDGLTGLANRHGFLQSVHQAIARSRRSGNGFALLSVDLDHFKDVNDTLGHPAGDSLLRQVAHRLQSSGRAHDVVARLGGDEFAVIEADVTDPTQVAAFAKRIHDAVREPFSIAGSEVTIGASVGMAIYGPEVEGAETLLSHADLALYRAKSEGRGRSRFFAAGMDAEVKARVALVSDLRDAIDSDELFVAYQPQVEIATGRIVGVEALARWRHPTRGVVGPGDFIPVAETSGLIVALGRRVLRDACFQAKAWLDAGIAPPIVAVNVSAMQFRTPGELETTLATILAETGLPPDRLEVELTESALMEAWCEQREVLVHLRDSGVKVAIDDFGTGFSSLQYLTRFPVDRLKIAQTFVAELDGGRASAAIVKATIGLARELGLQIIAEGVETRTQLSLLERWGCPQVQGFYFARPQPADDIEELLRRGTLRPHTIRPGTSLRPHTADGPRG